MENSLNHNYQRIAKAITFIRQNFKTQPNLDTIAEQINLSPFHFQRLFSEWAGISPKKFLQYISLTYAKDLLSNSNIPLLDVAFETGLSGTGRLHDLFVTIEGMTPGEYKNGGENLIINYNFSNTLFGNILIASTPKGVCYTAFSETNENSLKTLYQHFPKANFIQKSDAFQQNALSVFNQNWEELKPVNLHLKGTSFQLKIWEMLLKIPSGQLTSYGKLASSIQNPSAFRAVGTAIGKNPVAYLIPCHRVIKSNGEFGEYMWGATRKTAIIGWEAAKTNHNF